MKEKDTQLLLIDLCARLPYSVIAYASEINKNGIITDINISYNIVNLTIDNSNGKYESVPLFDIKPYLRSISKLTDEEIYEWHKITSGQRWITFTHAKNCFDWLNKHYVDYRGWIKKGLALEAPKNMYK